MDGYDFITKEKGRIVQSSPFCFKVDVRTMKYGGNIFKIEKKKGLVTDPDLLAGEMLSFA